MKQRTAVPVMAALLAAGIAGQVVMAARNPVRSPMAGESVIAALGGLRSVAAEIIWFRAERLQHDGRFGELVQLAKLLTFLEPHEGEVWSYAAWNLAYNISIRMPSENDRWPWVHEAIRLLRDDGLGWNPGDPGLCRELAHLFELKVGANFDSAGPLYRAEWRKIVEDVKSRGAWRELGMDPEKMAAVEKSFGISDWGNPQASAIYWAMEGLSTPNAKERPFLELIVRQACQLYFKPPVGGPRQAADAASEGKKEGK